MVDLDRVREREIREGLRPYLGEGTELTTIQVKRATREYSFYEVGIQYRHGQEHGQEIKTDALYVKVLPNGTIWQVYASSENLVKRGVLRKVPRDDELLWEFGRVLGAAIDPEVGRKS